MHDTVSRLKPEGDRKRRRGVAVAVGVLHTEAEANRRVTNSERKRSTAGALVMV